VDFCAPDQVLETAQNNTAMAARTSSAIRYRGSCRASAIPVKRTTTIGGSGQKGIL
jgi:hypothetical protein